MRVSPFRVSPGCVVVPGFDVLMGILDHHHRGIDHGADGDRNAAQRHDVRVHALVSHDGEGDQDPQRQGDDRDEGRADVEQEHQAYEGDDDEFLDQLLVRDSSLPV